MFYAIGRHFGRQVRNLQDADALRAQRIADANGWQVRRVAPGTWRYRDPRFDGLPAAAYGHPDGRGDDVRSSAAPDSGRPDRSRLALAGRLPDRGRS